MSRINPPASDIAVVENFNTCISTLPTKLKSRPVMVATVSALMAMRRRTAWKIC